MMNNNNEISDKLLTKPIISPLKSLSPKGLLLGYIQELVSEAAQSGNVEIDNRTLRKLQRLITSSVDVAAKELLHSFIEKYEKYAAEQYKDDVVEVTKKQAVLLSPPPVLLSPPEEVLSSEAADGVAPVVVFDTPQPVACHPPTNNKHDPVVLDFDDEQDATTNEFLSELKEEVVLQSLLHKRIYDKKERVFQLEHRNGRKLLVVLPPDIQSVASFEAEAEKTNWVAALLNTEEKVEGMLSVLLKSNPATFKMVGRKQKVPMKQVMLTTTQTIALVRVGGLNDFRMKKVRSYINHMAKANIELASK